MTYSVLITCPKGLEYLLEEELRPWGLTQVKVSPQGVSGLASLETIYQISLWSRVANRILLHLFTTASSDPQSLQHAARQFHWHQFFSPQATLAIHFQGQSDSIRNSMFGAQVIKDGIVDYCRDQGLIRPTVDKTTPDIRLRAYLKTHSTAVYLDLVGYSLHQRGYRLSAGEAPLKETVAAGLLLRAKWPSLSQEGYGFCDPCCGSGTLVIEAAMIANHMAPGLLRQDQAFSAWLQHDPALWQNCRQQALEQQKESSIVFYGSDQDSQAIRKAKENSKRAGVEACTHWSIQALDSEQVHAHYPKGLVLCNPPYGERLGEEEQLLPLYAQLGVALQRGFANWQAGVLTTSVRLAKAIGLRSHKQYRFYNGPLAVQLFCFDLHAENRLQKDAPPKPWSDGANMFANRLRKNLKHLRAWAQRQQISCYRVYDADLPEYAYAIDIYQDHAVLQEYAPPSSIDESKAEKRRQEVIEVVPEVLQMSPKRVVVKQRVRQRGAAQYEKLSEKRQWMTVREGDAQLRVNLHDYLDTGLFLDHRLLRSSFSKLSPNMRFLNCFCYTASASVHAAMAGALTTNVDMSQTYLNWAQENFHLNNIALNKHQFVHYDCIEWLKLCRDRFDVIFLDPPSFSNSKRMQQTLDIARDHEQLIHASMNLLAPQGILYFSTNLRRFHLNPSLEQSYLAKDITHSTIDEDFKRNAKIHQCFMFKRKDA